MKNKPLGNDRALAGAVAIVDIVILAIVGFSFVMAGLSFGAPSPHDLHQTAADRNGMLTFLAWLVGGGFCVAALFRAWRTGITHLILIGLPLLVGLAINHQAP